MQDALQTLSGLILPRGGVLSLRNHPIGIPRILHHNYSVENRLLQVHMCREIVELIER